MTLLPTTEQALEMAEIAAEARDYVAASRAEKHDPQLSDRLDAVHGMV